jgi:hypothetical protein
LPKNTHLTNKEVYSIQFKGTGQKLTNRLILLILLGIQRDLS